MKRTFGKKTVIITMAIAALLSAQTFAQNEHHHDDDDKKPENLKVFPKDISHKDLIKAMKSFSFALGVHCDFCHAPKAGGGLRPELDFASDAKPEKETARGMMRMVMDINEKYIKTMSADHPLEPVSCVTCHNGHEKPLANEDQAKRLDEKKEKRN
jgi:Photosynthetic reaction centre cytochrome C subunit